MIKLTAISVVATVATLIVSACATLPSPQALDAQATAAIKAAFRSEGIASAERVVQDPSQAACSSDKAPTDSAAEAITTAARASVKWPTGGRYIGDWREGEKLAQNGRGLTWTDASSATASNGGNCYNCHQITPQEISFGTLGPSLLNYGKLRGVSDVTAPTAQPIVEYTWMKLWNAKSYAACSTMPRFGHAGLLDEKQIAHLMALLLDPKSPANLP